MKEILKEIHDRYGNGQRYATIMRMVELFAVAAIVGIVTMYGTTSSLRGETVQISKQITELGQCVDRHIQNYMIHVPRK